MIVVRTDISKCSPRAFKVTLGILLEEALQISTRKATQMANKIYKNGEYVVDIPTRYAQVFV